VELYLHYPNTPSWRGAQLNTGTALPLPLPLPLSVEHIFFQLRSLRFCIRHWPLFSFTADMNQLLQNLLILDIKYGSNIIFH